MFGNMKEMMKQAQSMKSEMTKVKKELDPKMKLKGLKKVDKVVHSTFRAKRD